ncbi:MAG: PelD GGDEF domain-containing protein [Betaproteobacteria bacterium]
MLKFSRLIRPFTDRWAVGIETLALPLGFVLFGVWAHPQDPLWTTASFPWVWLAPVLLALRYGPFPGLAGAGVLVLAWLAMSFFGLIDDDFPKVNFLGGLILTMLCGEFSSLWIAEARRTEGLQHYLDQRLEYLTHQYYLLRLSHDRLEQDLLSRPMAMRDALVSLSSATPEEDDPVALPGAAGLLRLLAQYCQIEIASLHVVQKGQPDRQPAAHLGTASPLDPADPICRRALETGAIAHIARALAEGESPSRYLAAAPLITFEKQTIGLLAIERLPFFALNEETLQTLNLLLSYYADGVVRDRLAGDLCTAIPTCPVDFAFELKRLSHLQQESGAQSVIVALIFPASADFDSLIREISRQKRGLDVIWLAERSGRRLLATLMPMSGDAAAEGYLARIDTWAKQGRGLSLLDAGIARHVLPLGGVPPLALAQRLLELCDDPA